MKSGRNTLLIAISFGLFIDAIYYTNRYVVVDINMLFGHLNLAQNVWRFISKWQNIGLLLVNCRVFFRVLFSCLCALVMNFMVNCGVIAKLESCSRWYGTLFQMMWNEVPSCREREYRWLGTSRVLYFDSVIGKKIKALQWAFGLYLNMSSALFAG